MVHMGPEVRWADPARHNLVSASRTERIAMRAARRIDLPDFRALCEAACIKLWGNPSKRDSKELRWDGADAYSAKTFSLAKRTWYDHV